jgi:hypothetical protein
VKAPLLAGASDDEAHGRDGQAISTLSVYWLWATVAPFLAWGSVQACDDCGGGGDAVFVALAVVSWGFATGFVRALTRRSALRVSATLFAGQLVSAVAAYAAAGMGSGRVHVSGVFVVIGLLAEPAGIYAVARTYEVGRT